MSRVLTVIAVLMALATGALAETVDWSQYIDKNPSQPIAASSQAAPAPASAQVAAKPAKSSTRSTKVASKSKTKARAKTKARHK